MARKITPMYDAYRQTYVLGVEKVPKVVYCDETWRQILSAKQFSVMREHHYQNPFEVPSKFAAPLSETYFVCAGCDLPLYHSHDRQKAPGWLFFCNSIQHSVQFKAENSCHRYPEKSEGRRKKVSLRDKYFTQLNFKNQGTLGLRCDPVANVPFHVPSMGKYSSISKDGGIIRFYIMCSSCDCFVGTFFPVRARSEQLVSSKCAAAGSLHKGKHVIFPLSVKLNDK